MVTGLVGFKSTARSLCSIG